MNDTEFEQLVGKTRLGKRSVDAARLVLVEGKRQVDACQEAGIPASQLSRVITMLEKEEQLLKSALVHKISSDNPLEISHAEAVKDARDLLGENILVRHAPRDGQTDGVVLFKKGHHLIQKIRDNEVMVHESRNINQLPPDGQRVVFHYKNGLADARLHQVQKERGGR